MMDFGVMMYFGNLAALGSACSAGALVNLTHLRLAGNRVTDAASTTAGMQPEALLALQASLPPDQGRRP